MWITDCVPGELRALTRWWGGSGAIGGAGRSLIRLVIAHTPAAARTARSAASRSYSHAASPRRVTGPSATSTVSPSGMSGADRSAYSAALTLSSDGMHALYPYCA